MKKAGAEWNYANDLDRDVIQEWSENTELEPTENMSDNELFEEEDEGEVTVGGGEVFIQHMDIRDPIVTLR